MTAQGSDDYLWNGTGAPDPILDFCERYGSELSYDAQVVARARQGFAVPPKPARRWAVPVAVAAMVAGVTLGLGAWLRQPPLPSAPPPSVSIPSQSAVPSVAEPANASSDRAHATVPSGESIEGSQTDEHATLPPLPEAQPPSPPSSGTPEAEGPQASTSTRRSTESAQSSAQSSDGPAVRAPSARRARAGQRRPAPETSAPPAVQSFDERVQLFSRDLRGCFDDEARVSPGLSGNGMVSFSVQVDGRVTDAAIERSSFSDPNAGQRVGECITKRVGEWRFPAPSDPPLHVRLPFSFQ